MSEPTLHLPHTRPIPRGSCLIGADHPCLAAKEVHTLRPSLSDAPGRTLRIRNETACASFWLRVPRPSQLRGFFDCNSTMLDIPAASRLVINAASNRSFEYVYEKVRRSNACCVLGILTGSRRSTNPHATPLGQKFARSAGATFSGFVADDRLGMMTRPNASFLEPSPILCRAGLSGELTVRQKTPTVLRTPQTRTRGSDVRFCNTEFFSDVSALPLSIFCPI
ncbi:hypothetical protein CALVIDRAFT_97588 [Calocera viscosa TUFC12733]|uniref:Uncharacterized protein n=1 Tax=Calocera viscosa (strain TUFC12733) TaxID=1330018 RepID=A0A167MJ64_CALVF|nr:hypothetical protein CALVIDRAFT_97588 [Calocera viscosa TUFC12733]